MSEDFELSIKIASDISDAVEKFAVLGKAANRAINTIISGFKNLGTNLTAFGQQIEAVGKQVSKFGKDFVKNITLPLTALAGLSLKKVFDEALGGRGTDSMNRFAGAIQSLKKSFDQLLIDLGSRLAPILTPLIQKLDKLIQAWIKLDSSTKNIIITIGAVLAAIGPILVAFGTFLVMVGKLAISGGALATGWTKFLAVLKPIAAAISGTTVAIVAIIAAIAGMTNVFLKLREAGVGTFEALGDTVDWFAAQFGSIVGGNILKVVSKLLEGLGYVASFINKDLGNAVNSAAGFVKQLATDADDYAKQASANINGKLAKIGTTAAEAFSFGLFGGIQKEVEDKPIKFKLSPDVQQMIIDTKFALAEVQRITAEGQLESERIEAEHQAKMAEIRAGEQDISGLQAQIQRQQEFINLKHNLNLKEIEDERAKALAIAAINEDKTAKAIAIANAENKYKVDIAKATADQEKQIQLAAAAGEEQILQKRKEALEKYTAPAADGLSDAFISIADGTKTAEEAFQDFANSFLRQIAKMILQAAILKSINSAFGFSEGGAVQTFATGGHVRGPGTGTSDSIPARLSDGEFVMTAKAVKRYGANFFNNLNASARGHSRVKSMPGRYADGGAVTSSAQAPQVVIENTGSEKQVSQTSFDPTSQVLTVMMEDVAKNGPFSKALQGTFGMKRGSFR